MKKKIGTEENCRTWNRKTEQATERSRKQIENWKKQNLVMCGFHDSLALFDGGVQMSNGCVCGCHAEKKGRMEEDGRS